MRFGLFAALCVSGCGQAATDSSDHDLKTTYFTTAKSINAWFLASCGQPGRRENDSLVDRSLPDDRNYAQWFRCDLPGGSLKNIAVRVTGVLDDAGSICGIELGPQPITSAVDLSFIHEWFRDPSMAAKVQAAVGEFNWNHAYTLMTMVDGVRISARQFGAVDGARFHLVVDGCGRRVDPTVQRRSGAQLF